MIAIDHIQSMAPEVTFESIPMPTANRCLTEWGHKMGPCRRGATSRGGGSFAHGLCRDHKLIGVVVTSELIRPTITDNPQLNRENTIELARVCASRKDVCRVLLRLWRLFVFDELPHAFALSYQDAALHSGDLYRFDGWKRVARSRSGTDQRSGLKGRDKYIWLWSKST